MSVFITEGNMRELCGKNALQKCQLFTKSLLETILKWPKLQIVNFN